MSLIFPKRKILHSFKWKEFMDGNFKVDENGRKFSKWIKNTVGKGEIVRYEQFLLFPVFQKTRTADTQKAAIVWERVKFHINFKMCIPVLLDSFAHIVINYKSQLFLLICIFFLSCEDGQVSFE